MAQPEPTLTSYVAAPPSLLSFPSFFFRGSAGGGGGGVVSYLFVVIRNNLKREALLRHGCSDFPNSTLHSIRATQYVPNA